MSLQWFDSDGSTPLGNVSMGTIGPGETYTGKHAGTAKKVVLKNTGLVTLEGVAVGISQVASFPANQYLLIAVGATQPDGGEFVGHDDPDLVIGTLAPDDAVNIWLDMSVPLSEPRQLAQMVSLRAYGAIQTES